MKTVLLLLLIGCSCALGIAKAYDQKRQVKAVRAAADWLFDLELTLQNDSSTVLEQLKKSETEKRFEPLDFLFAINENIKKNRSLGGAYKEALFQSACAAYLGRELCGELEGVFRSLESGEREVITARCKSVKARVEKAAERLEAELQNKARLTVSLYCILGFAVAILFA